MGSLALLQRSGTIRQRGFNVVFRSSLSALCSQSALQSPVLKHALLSRSSTSSSTLAPKRITTSQHAEILASQRLNRPISPHLSIYQPQITWYSGALMRNSAILISAPVYIFGAAYLLSPLMGWHLDTASLVDWFGSLAPGTKLVIKGFFGFPFCFHIVHGLRHLIWDTGAMLTNRQVMVSGWLGLGISVLGTVGLMFW